MLHSSWVDLCVSIVIPYAFISVALIVHRRIIILSYKDSRFSRKMLLAAPSHSVVSLRSILFRFRVMVLWMANGNLPYKNLQGTPTTKTPLKVNPRTAGTCRGIDGPQISLVCRKNLMRIGYYDPIRKIN